VALTIHESIRIEAERELRSEPHLGEQRRATADELARKWRRAGAPFLFGDFLFGRAKRKSLGPELPSGMRDAVALRG